MDDNTGIMDASKNRSVDGAHKSRKTRRGKKRKGRNGLPSISSEYSEDVTVFSCMFCSTRLVVEGGRSPRELEHDILKICKECDELFPGSQNSNELRLRPKIKALAPHNSTQFIMDQESLYSLDFPSPKKVRTDAFSDDDCDSTQTSPCSSYSNSEDHWLDNESNDFESYLLSQFEMDFGVAREEELSSLPKDELVSNIQALKSRIDVLEDRLNSVKDRDCCETKR